jgi:GNAT superfamily N-acetyltransferase
MNDPKRTPLPTVVLGARFGGTVDLATSRGDLPPSQPPLSLLSSVAEHNLVIIRRASSADLIAIIDCVEASLEVTYGGLWTSDPLPAGDADWASAWVACSSEGVVGVGLTEKDAVSDLWVHPSAQGLGAGSALLTELENEIVARGFSTARLRCLEPNLKSRGFYASRGWKEVRVYPHESIPLNTVDLAKSLVARD